MTASSTQELIITNIGAFGTAMLAVVGAVLVIIVGFLVAKRGLSWLKRAK